MQPACIHLVVSPDADDFGAEHVENDRSGSACGAAMPIIPESWPVEQGAARARRGKPKATKFKCQVPPRPAGRALRSVRLPVICPSLTDGPKAHPSI